MQNKDQEEEEISKCSQVKNCTLFDDKADKCKI